MDDHPRSWIGGASRVHCIPLSTLRNSVHTSIDVSLQPALPSISISHLSHQRRSMPRTTFRLGSNSDPITPYHRYLPAAKPVDALQQLGSSLIPTKLTPCRHPRPSGAPDTLTPPDRSRPLTMPQQRPEAEKLNMPQTTRVGNTKKPIVRESLDHPSIGVYPYAKYEYGWLALFGTRVLTNSTRAPRTQMIHIWRCSLISASDMPLTPQIRTTS